MTATVLLAAASVVVGVDNSMSPEVMTRRVREARAAHPGARIEVAVADGVYAFSKPLVLGPGDSGEEDAPVVWKAKGRAVFCGGAPLRGWRDDGGGVWSCPAPRNSEGKLVWFNSLYANGRRADCARFPNRRPLAEEYLTPTDFRHVPPEGFVRGTSDDWGPGDEYFSFGKPFHEFDNLEEGELNHIVVKGCDAWTFSSHELLGYDEKKGEFHTYVQGRIFSCYWTGWNRALVWFENVRAGFDQPGEWFYDWTAGRIRYRPLVGEKIESLEALVPSAQLVSVMEIRGEPEKGAFVHDVEFEGLTFSCSMADGYLTPSGIRRQFPLQSAVGSGGAVYMRGAKRVTLRRCRVEHTENYGFRIDEGSQHCSILDCELTDLGAGGVFAGNTKLNQLAQPGDVNPEFRPGHAANIRPGYVYDKIDNLSVAFITIDNCLVSGGGRFNPEGSGILLTNVSDSKVVHNEIEDMYYTGVSVGWTWGYSRSVAQRNTIAFNRIHDFGKHVMADMGGVYTLGTSFGTAITNNVIYNVDSFSYGGWGLYNDEGSEGILWENNLVYDTTSSSYHLHYGRGNTVRNNILAFGREARIIISASNVEGGVDFERNIIVWDDTADASENRTLRFDDIYGGGDPGVTFKDNLFWNLTGETKLGDRAKGLVADPLFEDALKRDFRLKAGSPAVERLGFVPFDFSKAGRRPAKPASAPISQAGESSADVVRLKDAYAGRFLVGTCINRSQTARIQPEEDRLISATFNCATPENEMKPAAVQPEEGRWDFSAADAFVDYAQKRGMTVIGHCLVWHNTVGDWMFKGPDGKEASRDLLIERMRTHIHKVVSRYKGRVKGWDVVNEALEWDGSFYKPSKWYQIIGEDYVDLAFRFAHEADPDAELYYNDWDLARRSKADGVLRLVRRLKAKGLRIDAVGMQSHVSLTYPDLREYEKSMDDFIAAGVNVMVTELDVSVLPAAWNLSAEITARHDYEEKYDPYRSGLPAAKQQELADRYVALFRIFLRHAGKLTRVSFWGAHDGCSWLNDFPVAGRTDYPLLYDRSFKPKPCAFAVEKLACSADTDDYLRPVRPVGVNGQPACGRVAAVPCPPFYLKSQVDLR